MLSPSIGGFKNELLWDGMRKGEEGEVSSYSPLNMWWVLSQYLIVILAIGDPKETKQKFFF